MHSVNAAEMLYRSTISAAQIRNSMAVVYSLMWAVPCFLMVSGALLLDPEREMPLKKIVTKYILRMVIVLTVFVFLFRFFDMFMNGETFSEYIITDALHKLFTCKSWAHLWYVYALIALYICTPFVRAFISKFGEKGIKRALLIYSAIMLILICTVPFGGETVFGVVSVSIYLFYYILGFAIRKKIIKTDTIISGFIFVMSALLILLLSFYAYSGEHAFLTRILSGYASPLTVIESASLFAIFAGIGKEETKLISFIDSRSFGIYLTHMFIVRLVLRYCGVNPYIEKWWVMPALIVTELAFSIAVISVLKLIPGVKKLL